MEHYYINLIIILVWVLIWSFFYWGGNKEQSLTVNTELKKYSTGTITSLALFYTAIHWHPTHSENVLLIVASIAVMTLGAYLMISARRAMSNITAKEVMFSINPRTSAHNVYQYFRHPMYAGMFLLMAGALIAIPSLYAIPFFVTSSFFVYKKIQIENSAHYKTTSDSQAPDA